MGCAASSGTRRVEDDSVTEMPSREVKAVKRTSENDETPSADVPTNAPASDNIHFYCGIPHAQKNKAFLGSDPHQAGWLAGRWTSSTDDLERTDALRKLGILLTVRRAAVILRLNVGYGCWVLTGSRLARSPPDGSATALLIHFALPRLTSAGARRVVRPHDADGRGALRDAHLPHLLC